MTGWEEFDRAGAVCENRSRVARLLWALLCRLGHETALADLKAANPWLAQPMIELTSEEIEQLLTEDDDADDHPRL